MSSTAPKPVPRREAPASALPTYAEHVRELVSAIRRLSLARSVAEVQEVVRISARRLTGADGATFVLRDAGNCYYVDEDAISPLWKGQRFPIESCISGWAMLNRRPAISEDIYRDERIPHDAYRPTFVRSLVLVPIRTSDPIGAIGNYWATHHRPDEQELELLQALADSTAVAMENVRVYQELEQRVADRTAELEARTRELEDTNRSIRSLYGEATINFEALRERNEHHLHVLHTLAHEVRTPLAAGRGLLRLALDSDTGSERTLRTNGTLRADLLDIDAAVSEAIEVVSRQLAAASLESGAIHVHSQPTDLGSELAELRAMFRALARPDRVELVVEEPAEPIVLQTDRALLGHVLRNLVGNALKFTDEGEVRVRAERLAGEPGEPDEVSLSVSDTGIGIARADLERVFERWEQVDGAQPGRPAGSGLGLALVRRLVDALGGRLEIESEPGRGSTFTVALPAQAASR